MSYSISEFLFCRIFAFVTSNTTCHIITTMTSICFCSYSRVIGQLIKVDTTEAEIGVVFSSTIPTAELPQNEVVAQTLVDAANSNETFSVSLKASSIQVICKSTQLSGV